MITDKSFSQPSNKGEKKEAPVQTVEIVDHFDEHILQEILALRKDSIPESWQEVEDVTDWYREAMADKKYIKAILRENQKSIGFIMAGPQNEEHVDIADADPDMDDDSGCYYVEMLHILPEHRKGRGFMNLILKIIEEGKKIGINRFSAHVRVGNSLSKVVQKIFKVIEIRRIDNWKYYGETEPTDFIKIDCSE